MMEISTYKMNKTLKEVEQGKDVRAEDFIAAVNEKKKRKQRRSEGYQKILKKTIKDIKEEEERNETFKNTLEKKVKYCPKCGYKTVVENHKYLCIRKCRQCDWASKPFKRPVQNGFGF